jgi:hypothetical protein
MSHAIASHVALRHNGAEFLAFSGRSGQTAVILVCRIFFTRTGTASLENAQIGGT